MIFIVLISFHAATSPNPRSDRFACETRFGSCTLGGRYLTSTARGRNAMRRGEGANCDDQSFKAFKDSQPIYQNNVLHAPWLKTIHFSTMPPGSRQRAAVQSAPLRPAVLLLSLGEGEEDLASHQVQGDKPRGGGTEAQR